eukprot:jgi/Mesvir1/11889/Mv00234-RA.1
MSQAGTIADIGVTRGSLWAGGWKTDAVGESGLLPVVDVSASGSAFKDQSVALTLYVPWATSGARIGRIVSSSMVFTVDVDGVPLQATAAFSRGTEMSRVSSIFFMLGYVYNTVRDASGGWLMDQPGSHRNILTFTIPADTFTLDGVPVNLAIAGSMRLLFETGAPRTVGAIADIGVTRASLYAGGWKTDAVGGSGLLPVVDVSASGGEFKNQTVALTLYVPWGRRSRIKLWH